MPRHSPLVILAALVCLAAAAQEEKKKEAPEPSSADVRFADGSVVRMAVLQETLEVETKYGKLAIPTGDIRRIEFAFRVPEEKAKKIEVAIRDLGHDVHARREAANKELVSLGAMAVPALQAATKSSDAEVARQAKAALALIQEKTPAEKLRFPTHDTVQTTEFTLSGRIVTPAIKARTNYFGDVQVRIADMRQMHWLSAAGEFALTIDAAKYGHPNSQWMETDVTLTGTPGLLITASGQVDLQPQAPGQIVTGPNGTAALGRVPGGVGRVAPGGGLAARFGGSSRVTMQPGALLGKIGENGRIFVIGERYQGTPGEEGKLYLLIAPNPEGNVPSGTYSVKVTVNP